LFEQRSSLIALNAAIKYEKGGRKKSSRCVTGWSEGSQEGLQLLLGNSGNRADRIDNPTYRALPQTWGQAAIIGHSPPIKGHYVPQWGKPYLQKKLGKRM
jgi:hypothetical protein